MTSWPSNPVIYEINTAAWLAEHGTDLGDVPDEVLDALVDWGFDAIWLMGVWERSPTSQRIARNHPGLQAELDRALPDRCAADVIGSPYAIHRYVVDPLFGGDESLARLRQRLAERGLKLILDFVPNHLAADHPWVDEHPERFVLGTPEQMDKAPSDWFESSGRIVAHGRDPYFPGWTDTSQVDFRKPDVRASMVARLREVAARCDGVRCDMAMLVVREIFEQTWGPGWEGDEFWPNAIARVREDNPEFLFMAEVYWDMEPALCAMGFDLAYDKALYDRLRAADASGVRKLLARQSGEQHCLVRFIENHDEPRARGIFGDPSAQAAAAVSLTLPGARLLHEGQLEGRTRRLPVQLGRRCQERLDHRTTAFYRRLLKALSAPVFRKGAWDVLRPVPEWSGNPRWQHFVAHRWTHEGQHRVIVANLAPQPSQCFLPLAIEGLGGRQWRLTDLLHDLDYDREGDDLAERGLYLDMPGRSCHLFEVTPV